jgi:hypothetical protein
MPTIVCQVRFRSRAGLQLTSKSEFLQAKVAECERLNEESDVPLARRAYRAMRDEFAHRLGVALKQEGAPRPRAPPQAPGQSGKRLKTD